MRALRDILIIAVIMALTTRFAGWWSVPVVAAIAAVWDRTPRASVTKSALAAALAWGSLLLLQTLFGSSVIALGRDVATSLAVPGPVPLLLTLLLPAILAAAAAGVVAGLKKLRAPAAT